MVRTSPVEASVVAAEIKARGDKLLAAVAALSVEMESLGVSGAMITIDERKQQPGSTTLGFVGIGMGTAAGDLLLRKYLELRASPMAEVTYSQAVVSHTGEIQ